MILKHPKNIDFVQKKENKSQDFQKVCICDVFLSPIVNIMRNLQDFNFIWTESKFLSRLSITLLVNYFYYFVMLNWFYLFVKKILALNLE